MARNRDPFSAALASLRDRLESGAIPAGMPVNVVEEAGRLKLSTTPVREALAHLCGEGLVTRTGARGYGAAQVDRLKVHDLYELMAFFVRGALTVRAGGVTTWWGPRFDHQSPGTSVAELFNWLVRAAGNDLLIQAHARLAPQAAVFRRLEQRLFPDLAEEAKVLFAAFESRAHSDLDDVVARYFQRRIDAASAFAALARHPPGRG